MSETVRLGELRLLPRPSWLARYLPEKVPFLQTRYLAAMTKGA